MILALLALVAALTPATARAGSKTCLTGTDPGVVADFSQIPALRAQIDGTCVCASFDGSSGKTHKNYLTCVKGVISAATTAGNLRKQCKGTLTKYATNSTCGLAPSLSAAPCIKTTSKGKVTCTIVPSLTCSSKPGKFSRVACPGFTTCIDASDSNINGVIGSGDTGSCNPTGCCAFNGFGGGLCMDTSYANFVGPATCQQLNGTWVDGDRCGCDASTGACSGTCASLPQPTATTSPRIATPTQPVPPPPPTATRTNPPPPSTPTNVPTNTSTSVPTTTPTSVPTRTPTGPPANTSTAAPGATATPSPFPTASAACVCSCAGSLMCTDHPLSFNAIDCQTSCASMGCVFAHYCSGTSTYPTECAFCLTITTPIPTSTPTVTPTATVTQTATITPTPTAAGCTAQSCGTFSTCSTAGVCNAAQTGCVQTAEGAAVCMYAWSCSNQACTGSAECASGEICAINTCCGTGTCTATFCPVGGSNLVARQLSSPLASEGPTSFGDSYVNQ